MAATRAFSTAGVVPIPVGHRVEVTTFALRTSLFGGPTPSQWAPLIRDIETGVLYGRQWHFSDESCTVDELPFQVRHDLVIADRVYGRVLATRVVSGKLPDMGTVNWISTIVVSVEG